MAEIITVYGAPWCPDCKRSKKFLAEHRVPYRWVDVDEDAEGLRFIEELIHLLSQQVSIKLTLLRFHGL